MPRFVAPRDYNFFQNISRELVDAVVQTQVFFFKLSTQNSKVNIYGESLDKVYYDGVSIFGIVEYNDENVDYESGLGQDTVQEVTFRFNQETLTVKDVYPEIGDVIQFVDGYYEITNTNASQLVGGQAGNNFGITCNAYLMRKSQLNIEPRNI
jgi:hypothetical protein